MAPGRKNINFAFGPVSLSPFYPNIHILHYLLNTTHTYQLSATQSSYINCKNPQHT